jgi:hypothetical protein
MAPPNKLPLTPPANFNGFLYVISKTDDILSPYLASNLPALEIYGLSMHIGSQITSLVPFEIAFDKLRKLCQNLIKKGFKIKLSKKNIFLKLDLS